MTLQNNVTITQNTAGVTFTEKQHNVAKEISYTVNVPANTQAYLLNWKVPLRRSP